MHIYLIRHAKQESELCNDNTPLCPLGREQAVRAGIRLSAYGIDALYSSHLLRAFETAELIKGEIKDSTGVELEHLVREGIQEADFGDLTGMYDDVIAKQYREFMEGRYFEESDWGYPGGESGREIYNRAFPVLEEILHSGKERVAVVSHGGTIRCLLMGILSADLSARKLGNAPEYRKLPEEACMAARLYFGKGFTRGSITELFYDEVRQRFYLERFNDAAHLETMERNC